MTNNHPTTNFSKPLGLPALADDTPSRHPCKIRIPSAQKRFMFDPYKAQVTLGLESEEDSAESSDDGVDDSAFDVVAVPSTAAEQKSLQTETQKKAAAAPCPVEPYSPLTIGSGSSAPSAEPHKRSLALTASEQPTNQESQRRVPSPTPAPTAYPDYINKSGLSSHTFSHQHPAPSFPLPPPQQDGLTISLNAVSSNSNLHHLLAPAARVVLSDQDVGDNDCNDDDEDDGHSQQVGGAHYTSEDGCFRMHAGSMHHALVRFKFSEDVYVVPLCDRRGLCVGDLVVVEGDRGENIGQVAADASDQHDPEDMSQKQIIRRALNKDRKKYYHARRKDALASKAAQQIVQDFHLKMHVLDAEFQSDLMKLTIYFRSLGSSGEAIDFREIQRGLFKQFRCRIWLLNWDEDRNLQRLVSKQLLSQPGKQSTIPAPAQPGQVMTQQQQQHQHTSDGNGAFFVQADAFMPPTRGATPPPAAPAMFHMNNVVPNPHPFQNVARNAGNDAFAMYNHTAPSMRHQQPSHFAPQPEMLPPMLSSADPHLRYNNFPQPQRQQMPQHNFNYHAGGQQPQQPAYFAPRR